MEERTARVPAGKPRYRRSTVREDSRNPHAHNEGTYLLWLDCTGLGTEDPADFFLKRAYVKVSSGKIYGYSRYVRFNYGCPRAQLVEALDRIEEAVNIWRKFKK